MHIIADAGAVGRWIIRAIDFHLRLLSEGHLQHVGYQVRFFPVMLATTLGGPRRVEVAQRHPAEVVEPPIPGQRPLDHPLGLAVRVDRVLG